MVPREHIYSVFARGVAAEHPQSTIDEFFLPAYMEWLEPGTRPRVLRGHSIEDDTHHVRNLMATGWGRSWLVHR